MKVCKCLQMISLGETITATWEKKRIEEMTVLKFCVENSTNKMEPRASTNLFEIPFYFEIIIFET